MNKVKRKNERIVEPLAKSNKKSDIFVLKTPKRDLSKLVLYQIKLYNKLRVLFLKFKIMTYFIINLD